MYQYRPSQWVNDGKKLGPNWRQCPVCVLAPEDRISVQCPSFQGGTGSLAGTQWAQGCPPLWQPPPEIQRLQTSQQGHWESLRGSGCPSEVKGRPLFGGRRSLYLTGWLCARGPVTVPGTVLSGPPPPLTSTQPASLAGGQSTHLNAEQSLLDPVG